MKKLIAAAMTASLLLCSNGVIVMAEADTDVSEETTAEAESDGIDEAAEAADTGISPYRACEHTNSYQLAEDSHEATDTEGGLRHYVCSECGAEYSYQTDPLVYEVNQANRQISLAFVIQLFRHGNMYQMESLMYSGPEMMKSGEYISMAPTTKREKVCAAPSRFSGQRLCTI